MERCKEVLTSQPDTKDVDTVLVPLHQPDALEVHQTVAAVTVLGEQNRLEIVPVATQPVRVENQVGQFVRVALVKQDLYVLVAVCGAPYVVVTEFAAEHPTVMEVPTSVQNWVVASVQHDLVVTVPVRGVHDPGPDPEPVGPEVDGSVQSDITGKRVMDVGMIYALN